MKKNLMTPALKTLFQLLDNQVYFVGGAVRDTLMKRCVQDIDLTTPLTPQQIMDRLKKTDIKIHPTGIEHGTLTLILSDKTPVEITSFRTDTQTDGRHAKVVFGKDITQDAIRRDFTINALYMDVNGKILDFTGGQKDLRKKRLRFIGNPEKRIEEDALRILRYFRLYAQLELKKVDLPALKACRKQRHLLRQLSKERIRDELFKLLTTPTPQKALLLMVRTGVLKEIIGLHNLQALRFLIKREKQAGIQTEALFRLFVLCAGNLPDWPLTRAQKKQVESWKRSIKMSFKTTDDYYNILYKEGKNSFLNMLLLKKRRMTFSAYHFYQSLCIPIPPFNNKDISDFFHVSGKELGQKIKLCEDIWLEMKRPTKKEVVFQKILD